MKTRRAGTRSRQQVRNGVIATAALGGLLLTCTTIPIAASAAESAAPSPVASDAPWTKTVSYLVDQLTASEKISLLRGGAPVGGPTGTNELDPDPHGQAGYIKGVPRLGIPENRHVDALGVNVSADTTASPSRIGLASSFSRELLGQFGQLTGEEGLGTGMTLIYGPQADLARTPSWSRNNTAYSEDAYLASQLMSDEITGIQGTGLMSQVKHVGMYNGQAQATPSIVEGQAAHEIYLAPAEQAAKDGVSSMMCSYATFQIKDDPRYSKPDYACENSVLMQDIIKNDWNFKGFITSDYNALHSTSDLLAGVNQEFATSYFTAANLQPLIDPTSADYSAAYQAAADDSIARTLYQDERFGLLDNQHIPAAYQSDVPQHGDVDVYDNTVTINKKKGIAEAEELAERSAVLLKNDNSALPLSKDSTVNVVGTTSNLLPAAPGGERSQGFGDRATISPIKGLQAIGGSKVSSNPGVDALGTTVPAANLKQDVDGTAAGLTRTETPAGGGAAVTTTSALLDGKQTDLVRGNTYKWTGFLDVPADDTYQLNLQRPYGKDSGDDSKFNDGITRASGSAVALSVDGASKTLANPDSNILQNAIPSYATGTANKITADNGQYLGYDNTAASVQLTAGRHAISITYTPTATVPATPTLRLAWSAKADAVAKAVAAAATHDVSVIFADDSGSTGGDGASTSTDVKSLSAAQNSLITQVAAAAHANGKKAVVVLNTGSAIQTPWVDDVDGILEMWYPGQEGGTATAKLLYGQANPSGHLTISFPKNSAESLFGVTDTNGDGTIGAGDANWERSNATKDEGETAASFKWSEGLAIGYRWFTDSSANTKGYAPQFAFGHGLSYTDYAYSGLSTKTATDGGLDVTFTVKNTGERAGYDAPQVYVGPSWELDSKIEQTQMKLAQFDAVKLNAGESKTLSLHVQPKDLSSYSTENNNWVLGTGSRSVYLGAASDDIRLQATGKVVSHAEAPVVTAQPAATTTAKVGQKVTLKASASGSPAPTVRWQQSNDRGATWTDVADALDETFTYTAAVNGAQYRAAFTNDLGTAYTNVNKLTIKKTATTVKVTLAKKSITHTSHAKVTVRVSPTSGKPTGTVTVHYGTKSKKVTLSAAKKGSVSITLPLLKKGTYKVYASYGGNATYAADSSTKVTLTVR